MRISVSIFILVFSLFFFSCKKADSPTSASSQNRYSLSDYGFYIEPSYYKVWSDSSWESYYRTGTTNGTPYVTIITSDGNEYFYNSIGYAGFAPPGQSLISFNTPILPLPDTIEVNKTYTRETTFSNQGTNYTMKIEETLQGIANVSVSFGTFNPCLWFKSKMTMSYNNQSSVESSEYWLAKGPSEIKKASTGTPAVVMVRGIVNSKGWGVPDPKVSSTTAQNISSQLFKGIQRPLFRIERIMLPPK